MPNHLKNAPKLFMEGIALTTMCNSSLAAENLLIQLQHKINVQILAGKQKFQDWNQK